MMQQRIDIGTWRGLINALESLLPYYERTNFVNTLFLLPLWRRELSNRVGAEDVVLEIGSGTGGLARLLKGLGVVCLDPSRTMLQYARDQLNGSRYGYVSGIAEDLPFAPATFDRILCSFSFRDFMDKRKAFAETFRALRGGGTLHILDLLRPDDGWRRLLMDAWIDRAIPVIAEILVPRRGRSAWRENPYVPFSMSYKAMSPIKDYIDMAVEAGFVNVSSRFLGMRSVFLLRAVRPRTT